MSTPEMASTSLRSPFGDADTPNITPRGSYLASSDRAPSSSQLISPGERVENDSYAVAGATTASSPLAATDNTHTGEKKSRRHPIIWILLILGIIAVILVIVLPVYFVVVKPRNRNSSTASAPSTEGSGETDNNNTPSPSPEAPVLAATTGGDGSEVTDGDGNKFTYKNTFGGYWVYDAKDPYNNGARPNSWTPPLNQSWNWGTDKIFGVNLGGLFVLEPFISPALFQKYPGTIDEWSLSIAMAADTAAGGLSQLEDHYKTFITEQDIAEIAGAGLNWIRLPVPFWAIDSWNSTSGHAPTAQEPFMAKTSWKYIVRVLGWARKYGLRVCLDLHAIPGSQNGYNHSGKWGQVNFLYGNMGMANAQRALSYIRTFTEFINRPEWRDVVPIFGIMNEALTSRIGVDIARSFYQETYRMMRDMTGLGAGNGPFMAIHDGFRAQSDWAGTFDGADRVMLDSHPYFAFSDRSAVEAIDSGTDEDSAGGVWPARACSAWGSSMRTSHTEFGITFAGEFSNGFNDCGLFLRGVPGSHTYGGDCGDWEDSRNWTPGTKAGLQAFIEASMDALGDYFFWTWKIGNSTAGFVEAPLWSYKLGLENGWIPTDPRTAIGKCQRVGQSLGPFPTTYSAWQTGGGGSGSIAASASQQWPPAAISGDSGMIPVGQLPLYTTTGTEVRLAGPTSISTASESTVTGGPIEVNGCSYLNGWDAITVALPAGACTGTSLLARGLATPTPTILDNAPRAFVTPPPKQFHRAARHER